MKRACVGACLVLLALLATRARAADQEWSRFRGPNGSGIGHAPDLPVKWTEKDYNWKVALPGIGHSSPILWGDRIFLTAGDKATAKRIILCVKALDGSTLWERQYDSKPYRMNPDNSYGTSTPAADESQVYFYWAGADEVAVVALGHDGKEAWRRNLGPFDSEHGSGASPIVLGDLVIVGNDQKGKSFLVALDRKTGETRWKLDRADNKAAYSTPCVYQPEGGPPELILASTGRGVTSVNPKTGMVNWELADCLPLRVVASPVVVAGMIVDGCGVGGSGRHVVAVRPGSKQDGKAPEAAYFIKKQAPYVPTVVSDGKLMFLVSDGGVATCVRAATGEEVWQERLNDRFYGSPVWVDGRLYVVSRKGVVYVIAAAEKFELLGANPLGEGSFATPAIAGGRMFLRTFSHLISIGGKKP